MTEEDILTLARTVYGEARGEDDTGKKAVIYVIINRFKSGKWFAGKTLAETCLKKWQFSCWNENDPNRDKMLKLGHIELKPYFELIRSIEENNEDITGGATHYYNPYIVKMPDWAKEKTPCFVYKNHRFYKDID